MVCITRIYPDNMIIHMLIGWRQGFGILFDDLVAAACTVGVLMAWRALT